MSCFPTAPDPREELAEEEDRQLAVQEAREAKLAQREQELQAVRKQVWGRADGASRADAPVEAAGPTRQLVVPPSRSAASAVDSPAAPTVATAVRKTAAARPAPAAAPATAPAAPAPVLRKKVAKAPVPVVAAEPVAEEPLIRSSRTARPSAAPVDEPKKRASKSKK